MSDKLDKLFRAARAEKPNISPVEYAFETRLLARLQSDRPQTPWYALAWRFVPFCAAIVLVAGIWSYRARSALSLEIALAGGEETTLASVFVGD